MITSSSLQYAKALFDLALLNHHEDEYGQYLKVIVSSIEQNNDFQKILTHPSIAKDERKNVLNNIFKEYVNSEFLHFLYVLIDNDRLIELKDIYDSYEYFLDIAKDITNATIYTKYELDLAEKNNLIKSLENYYKKKLIVNFEIDEKIIGGMVIKVKDQIIDASIFNKITNLKNELKKGW